MSAARSVSILATAVLVVVVLANGSHGAEARRGLIAFEGRNGLYTVPARGGKPTHIRGTLPGDGNPRWSPDGKRLAFDRHLADNWDVYVMNADGTEQRQLTFSPADDDFAAWAPHGRSLVFTSGRDGFSSVYALDVSSGAARRVARDGRYPDWMPDGRILFSEQASRLLHTIRPYGADRQPLATAREATAARVSDDGKLIVLQAYLPSRIFTAQADGSAIREQAPSRLWNLDPNLSPDRKWIVFDRTPSRSVPRIDIYIVAVNGTRPTRLTTTGDACCADWSFSATRDAR